MSQTTYALNGMTCQHCVATVNQRLNAVEGVQNANVQLMPPRANIEGDGVTLDALKHALEGTKFTIDVLG